VTVATPYKNDWPYGKGAPPARGDVIPVVIDGRKTLATVRYWNKFGLWLRARRDGAFVWLSLREIEYNYARHW
jgi:hypothetical protein